MRVKAVVIALLLQAGAWGLWSPQDTVLLFPNSTNPDSNQEILIVNNTVHVDTIDSVYAQGISGDFMGHEMDYTVTASNQAPKKLYSWLNPLDQSSFTLVAGLVTDPRSGQILRLPAGDTAKITNITFKTACPASGASAAITCPDFTARLILTTSEQGSVQVLAIGRYLVCTNAAKGASVSIRKHSVEQRGTFTASGKRVVPESKVSSIYLGRNGLQKGFRL